MKGYVYTIEVMLAVAAIMVTLVLVFSRTPEQPETDVVIIKQNGYNALYYMDQAGDLRYSVYRNATDEIRNNLTYLLPASMEFDVQICTGACSGTLPPNVTVVAVDYYVSAYRDAYIGKKVRLWMWEIL